MSGVAPTAASAVALPEVDDPLDGDVLAQLADLGDDDLVGQLAELFLSTRTVEANLSRVYQKLGVRSRVELAARLRGAG